MSTIDIHRVNALPDPLAPHSLYIVKATKFGIAELVFTDSASMPFKVIDSAEVETLIAAHVGRSSTIAIYRNFDEFYANRPEENSTVYVIDTSGENEVDGASALYSYDSVTGYLTLLLRDYKSDEYIQVKWENVLNAPVSSPEEIDQAVHDAHTHENAEVLDSFSEVDGALLYKGAPIGGHITIEAGW